MMFVPGNNPGMMADAHIYGPDSIMLDLEDSVTMAEKDAARLLVHNALKSIDYGTTEMVVRINPLNTPYGKKDVEAVVKAGVDNLTEIRRQAQNSREQAPDGCADHEGGHNLAALEACGDGDGCEQNLQ